VGGRDHDLITTPGRKINPEKTSVYDVQEHAASCSTRSWIYAAKIDPKFEQAEKL